MKTLVVEDDEDKRAQIVDFLRSNSNVEADEAKSYQSGLKKIMSEEYDLIILDMSMTTFDINSEDKSGGRPQPFGGRELMYQIKRRDKKCKTIVVTQYDEFRSNNEITTLAELDRQLQTEFSQFYLGAVHYDFKTEEWKVQLKIMLEKQIN